MKLNTVIEMTSTEHDLLRGIDKLREAMNVFNTSAGESHGQWAYGQSGCAYGDTQKLIENLLTELFESREVAERIINISLGNGESYEYNVLNNTDRIFSAERMV